MGISQADSALSARPKANAPHMAGHYLSLVTRDGIDYS